ncbi:MAG: glycosyltransferase family 4 protein [Anaerolineales bacterium]|jgi:glycosyltransferase involved in cell wall biosynthesis
MRLAILNQFYKPDLAPTGHLAASLAEHRALQGDSVTVITSLGGYVPSSRSAASQDSGNLQVIRLWTPRLGKERGLFRIIDYALFYIQALLRFLVMPAQDVVISLTTPPFISWAGLLHKWLHRSTKLVLWNMDCYPEILARTGVLSEDSLVYRALRGMNKALFKHLDYLICLDDAMCQLLTDNYSSEAFPLHSKVIPNWEPMAQFSELPSQGNLPVSFDLNLEGQFVVLYLGNAGFGHSFETVLEAASMLRDEPVSFLFVGGGSKWHELGNRKEALQLNKLHLRPYVPKERTPEVMVLADCALITLNESALGVISPSKLHSNLAMGLPIIYIGPEGGNVDQAIKSFNCGVSLRHGEVRKLVDFIQTVRRDEDTSKDYRRRARQAFETSFNDRVCLPEFDEIIDFLGPDKG